MQGLGGGADGAAESVQVAGVTLVARQVEGLDKDGLRALVDRHRDQIKSGVVVLAAPADGKVLIVAGVTPDLVKRIPAGQVVKQLAPIVGGGGGGRPDFAEAGGKDPSKIARAPRREPRGRREAGDGLTVSCGRAGSGAPSSFRHTAPKPNPRAPSSGISRAVASTVCR